MKKLLLASIIFCFNPASKAQVTNGLIAYYPFNGNADDTSGHGHNGTVHNAVLTADRYGLTNRAYSFNGSNSIIEIPDHADFHMTNFTISAWLNVNNVFQSFISKDYGSSYFNSYTMGYDNNSLASALSDGASSVVYYSGIPLPSGWFYYTLSFDDANNELKFYVNGVLSATMAATISLAYDNSIITIGGEYNNGVLAYMTSGTVDEVRMYNRVLTQDEITQLANDYPSASISNKSLTEGNSGTSVMKFRVTLDHPSDTTIKIKYKTADSTATAGTDYVATQGTLKFSPGKTSKTISVTINGDVTHEENEKFKVLLSNPVNAVLADAVGIGTITNDDAAFTQTITGLIDDDAITKPGIILSPNPAKDVLHIAGRILKNTIIEIIDVNGKVLITNKALNAPSDINISKLPPGNYFAKTSVEGHIETVEFIKQ